MSKKKKYHYDKENPNRIIYLSPEEATMLHKPQYNAHLIGHGVHGDVKYNRRREKKNLKRDIDEEL